MDVDQIKEKVLPAARSNLFSALKEAYPSGSPLLVVIAFEAMIEAKLHEDKALRSDGVDTLTSQPQKGEK